MGISIFKQSSCSGDTPVTSSRPNPNKFRFEIERLESFDSGWCVAVVKYPDCTNYEGRKVLVYDSVVRFGRLQRSGAIDPHFDHGSYSPVARFEPTARGITLARDMARRGFPAETRPAP